MWKKSIVGSIRDMEIGGQIEFPLEKRMYLLNLISYRLKSTETEKRWSLRSDTKNQKVTITRVS